MIAARAIYIRPARDFKAQSPADGPAAAIHQQIISAEPAAFVTDIHLHNPEPRSHRGARRPDHSELRPNADERRLDKAERQSNEGE